MLKGLSLLLFCLGALPAAAADYPTHAIKMVVPFAPGGGTDVLGRIIAQRLSEQWGQPVVIETSPALPAVSAPRPPPRRSRTAIRC